MHLLKGDAFQNMQLFLVPALVILHFFFLFLSECPSFPLSFKFSYPSNELCSSTHNSSQKNVDEYIIWMSTTPCSENCSKIKEGPIIYCKVLIYATLNGLDSCHLLLDIIIFVRLQFVSFPEVCSYNNWGHPPERWLTARVVHHSHNALEHHYWHWIK